MNGTNFDSISTNDLVMIGGAPAAVTSATTTRLTATVGANALTGPVSVTTLGGTAITANNFVVLIYKSLSFTASVTAIPTGGHQQFAVAATKYDNTTVDVTSNAVWTSADSTKATVSSSGVVTAGAAGATDITAAFSGLTATVHVSIATPVTLPPGTIQGPPVDPTVPTTIADSIRFLYTGPNAIQTGVAASAISDNRAAVVSGSVLDITGAPLSGVVVATAQHPEFGQTVTRADGRYDFVWNGGGSLHLTFTKPGYIASDRVVTTKWNQQKPVDDVALVAYDGAVTTITAGAGTAQVAQGSSVTDADGTRRATIIFPAGTTATLTNADGTTQPATTLHVRATEFTIGVNGPKAMPADLPPSTAYTYCVDLSVDEAPGATFSNPVPVYVENVLGFPVGTPIPMGYFDRFSNRWVPSPNGVVLKILTVANGAATIDTDGDGVADDPTRLNDLGIDSNELAQLATLYSAGQTLWRTPITHFTPYDMNWPYGPSDAIGPQSPAPDISTTVSECQECPKASVIETENQRVRESIPIQGTPYSLEYNSGRAGLSRYQVTVHATGASVPSSLKSVTLTFSIAGRTVSPPVAIAPNQDVILTWDGRDGYGRPVQGSRVANISLTYTYPATYGGPPSQDPAFALLSPGTAVAGDRNRAQISYTQGWTVTMGQISNVTGFTGFGGWTFSAQANYDPTGDGALYEAGSTERIGDPRRTGEAVLVRVAGNGALGTPAMSGIAANSIMVRPTGIAPLADGSFYVVCGAAICMVDALDNLSVVAGNPTASTHQLGSSPDGSPALGATILPFSLAVAPDGTLYFSEDVTDNNFFSIGQIRRIVNGVLQTVAGGFQAGAPLGDGGPATAANVGQINGMTFDRDGALYISDGRSLRVRRIGTEGIITTVAGGGSSTADNIPALTASIVPLGIAFSPDGILYFSSGSAIRRLTNDGILHYVVGTPTGTTALQDGGIATAGSISNTWGVTVAADGTLLFASTNGGLLWTVNGGIAHVFAGTGNTSTTPPTNGIYARAAVLQRMFDIKAAPDGSVYLAIADANATVKTQPVFRAITSGDSTILPDRNAQFAYVFQGGRHVRTVNLITGTTVETLSYEGHGYLSAVTDVNGQTTTIERDTTGVPTAIVAPGGQRTELSVGSLGLERVTNSAGGTYSLSYNGLGLLSQLVDPRQGVHKFTYDDFGHLTKDEDPAGGFLTLTRSGSPTNFSITRVTAEGLAATLGWQLGSALQTTRPVVGSDGLTTTRFENANGSTLTTTRLGTVLAQTVTPDSRFGMSAPVTSTASIKMPSGLILSTTSSRQTTLADPTNPLSVSSFVETLAINGRSFGSSYTSSNRTFTLTTPTGRTKSVTLDAFDRANSIQVLGLTPVTLGYESHGLISTITAGARQTTFAYDDHLRVQTVKDSLGRTVSFAYDPGDHVTVQTLPDMRQIAFGYDAAGNVTSITPPSRPAHSFTFTPVDLLGTYVAPTIANVMSTTTTYSYNRDRRLTSVLRPDGATISLGYDTAGRLSTLTEPLGMHQFGYDPAKGMLTSISTPDGNALRFAYDGDLLTNVAWSGALTANVGMTYDTSFRLTLQNVDGGNAISFGYDNDGLLLSAGALTLRRDSGNGLLIGATLGNLTDTYGYNSFGEVTSHALQLTGSTIFSLAYTRDNGGRISAVTETANGQTATTSYGYDSAGRLTDVTKGTATTHYGYDDNGNRISVGSISATYDAQDRITTYNGANYFYSDNGELQKTIDTSGTTLYVYDTLGNLREVTLPNGNVIDYVIDAANRRVGKKLNGALVAGWIYGDARQIIAETDGNGTVTKRFVYASRPNAPDYMIWSGNTYRIVSDHLGSPRYLLEVTAGTLAEALTYDEFGNVLSDTNPGFQPFGFAGGLYDPDTRLTRFGARDYSASIGRWCAKDPIRFRASDTNLYDYAFSDPINGLDQSGLVTLTISGTGTAGAGGAVTGSGGIGGDLHGNVGVVGSAGVGGMGGISASGGVQIQITNATLITDLNGQSLNSGGSIEACPIGLEHWTDGEHHGINVNIGPDVTPSLVETHSTVTQTWVATPSDLLAPIRDAANAVVQSAQNFISDVNAFINAISDPKH
ncbi:MAG TPA: RHS repeat-associated core domain-containing protein [Thermoanaerobaculia bacterium]